jgi:hypothetical protein
MYSHNATVFLTSYILFAENITLTTLRVHGYMLIYNQCSVTEALYSQVTNPKHPCMSLQ